MKKCPCEECISLAICRHKQFAIIFHQCSIIEDHVTGFNEEGKRDATLIEQLEKTLNPTLWTYDYYQSKNFKYKLVLNKDTMKPRYTTNDNSINARVLLTFRDGMMVQEDMWVT